LTWFNDAVLSAIQDRNRAYSSYRFSRSPENWDGFRSLRNRVIRSAKRRLSGRFLDLSGDPKKLWRNIRSFGLISGDFDNVAFAFSADELNIYFTSPSGGTDPSDFARPLNDGDSFSFSCIDEVCVTGALGKIISNATGLNGIPLVFIKLLLPLILPVLTALFNCILTSSTFPLVWKISSVAPIPKVRSPSGKYDYRLISILPVLAKAFENFMYEQMVNYVGRNGLFSSFQYCKSLR
jgi:hypothetical protein